MTISSSSNLSIINSKIINKRLPLDFNSHTMNIITAVAQTTGEILLNASYFENYTYAVEINSANVKTIRGNNFTTCPSGTELKNVNNATIEEN